MLVLGLDIDYLTEDYRVDLVFACYVEYGHGLPILRGDDNVIVQECAIHREVVVVARRKPEADGICVGGQFGIELVAEVEFLHQSVPGAVGGGFEEGDVEGEGVIDGEVVDVAGGDAVGIVVAAVEVADVALGEEVAPGGDGGNTEEGEEEEGENPLFHRLAIITFTRVQASSVQHWRLPLTLYSPFFVVLLSL